MGQVPLFVVPSRLGWRSGAGDGPDEACHLSRDGRDDNHLGFSGRNQMAVALAHPELSFPGDITDGLRQRFQPGKELRTVTGLHAVTPGALD